MKITAKQLYTIPNLLSLIRILLVPVFVYLYFKHYDIAATLILVLSGLTDCVDGYIARHFNQITDLGKILDPFADKLTQAAVAIMLTIKYRQMAPLLAVFVIKELLMLVGGLFILKSGKHPGGAQWWGKLATIIFYGVMIIIVAFGNGMFGITLSSTTVATLISIAAVFMIFSFLNYIPIFVQFFKENRENKKANK